MIRLLPALLFAALAGQAVAQKSPVSWSTGVGNSLSQPVAFYGSPEALRIAETVLLEQRDNGGWPRNYDRVRTLDETEREDLLKGKGRTDTSFDNGSTHSDAAYLAKVYNATGDERCREAFLRGVGFMLEAQYPNGGWPQTFPNPRGYSAHVTFNDGAMTGVLTVLKGVAGDREAYPFADAALRARCAGAVERGVRCILDCQIVVDGRRTAWCAQHDEKDLAPRGARTFEPASISGAESVGVVRFLLSIDDPSPDVVEAVEGAVAWFEEAKLTGFRVEKQKVESAPGGSDLVVVEDPDAPPIWARFNEIGTNKPIFCSRDGIPRETLAEISHERRNGYSWLGYYPAGLLERDYPLWRAERADQETMKPR